MTMRVELSECPRHVADVMMYGFRDDCTVVEVKVQEKGKNTPYSNRP